jgi:MFS family permease
MEFLRQHPEFLKLWSGQAVSAFGSNITAVAMPLVGVLVLHMSALEMGVLSALTVLPHLLFGLLAGVWVDRVPRRTILIVGDLARALLLGTIPVLAVAGRLRPEHLYAVAFLTGLMTLLFDTAATSLVPALVGRANLLRANSAWVLNNTISSTAGPTVGGLLVQLLTAPIAIAFDAVSFLVSAGCALLVVVPAGPAPGAGRGRVAVLPEIAEGLRAVFGNRYLSALIVSGTVGALAGSMQSALVVLYFVRDLSLSPAFVGLAVAATGVASVVSALFSRSFSERLGPGLGLITGSLLSAMSGVLLAAAMGPAPVVAVFLLCGQAFRGLGQPLFSVPQTTIRQTQVPDHVLGRVNATWRFLVFGGQSLGALLGGALGGTIGLRATLVVGSLGILAACLRVVWSPLRSLRQIPDPVG